MTDLPRPATPGPWGDDVDWIAEGVCKGQVWADDARAIAALPDWIARCDRLEALLREVSPRITKIIQNEGHDLDDVKWMNRIDAELGVSTRVPTREGD